MRKTNRYLDLAGFSFFTFTTLVSALWTWEHPSMLGCLYTIHNSLLAFYFTKRYPTKRYDRTGLWLGLIAAFLPTLTTSCSPSCFLMIFALAAYSLILWSVLALGPRFGIAPADRGLTCQGPYRLLRHPMYLGELVFRLVMVLSSPDWVLAGLMSLGLMGIQCWRILRGERMIEGYACYARVVRWRMVPGIW